MSQMTSFVIAENAAWKLRVSVTTAVVRPMKAHAPTGNGESTSPLIVDKKMLNNAHACGTTASGRGTRKFNTNPTPTETANGTNAAPFHTNPPSFALAAAARVRVVILVARAIARASRPIARAIARALRTSLSPRVAFTRAHRGAVVPFARATMHPREDTSRVVVVRRALSPRTARAPSALDGIVTAVDAIARAEVSRRRPRRASSVARASRNRSIPPMGGWPYDDS